MRIICLLCLLGLLCGCSKGGDRGPTAPDPEFGPSPESPGETVEVEDPDRGLTVAGLRILRGSDPNYDPGSVASPSKVEVAASAGQIGLAKFRIEPHPVEGVINQPHLIQFRRPGGSYGYLNVLDGYPDQYLPVYQTGAGPFEVWMYNSATAGGGLYTHEAYWRYDVSVVNREDADEPNDDDNPTTYADRMQAVTTPALAATYHRSFFQQADTNKDVEDWFKLSLRGGVKYRFEVTNSNGTWGTWNYTYRIVNNSGAVVLTHINVTATSYAFFATPGGTTTQTYYLQVSATPTSRRGNSVYYGKHSLKMVEAGTTRPVVQAVSPANVVVGKTGELKTWSATVTGGGTLTYNWQFTQAFKPTGPGTACNDCRFDRRVFTSTSATPKMRLGLPGLHSGFLTVSNSMGASDPFFFVYTIGSWGGDRDIPLDVVVIKNNATTYPQAIGGLTAWSKEGFESWVDLYVDDAFLPSGINLKVTDYREVIDATYYRLDSGAEDTSFINTYWPQNQPFRLTMYVVDSLHDAQGWMYDNDCDLISDNRGCVWSGTNSRAYDVNTAAHELGHILSLPHIRTTTNPLTNANYNLMSYGTDELSCCICISREENLGACSAGQLHSENPHHQYTVMADYVETYM